MSVGMTVYLVDEAAVKAVLGSNDSELFDELLAVEGQGESLASLDQELDIEEQHPGFTHSDALRGLFAGRVTRPEAGFAYACAFGHICSARGEWVHNAFHRCSGELLRELDTLFAAHGVKLRFWGGLIRNPPVPLPETLDGPYVGHWLRADAVLASLAFQRLRAAGPHGEPWFEEYLDEIGKWISRLEQLRGSMIVAVWC